MMLRNIFWRSFALSAASLALTVACGFPLFAHASTRLHRTELENLRGGNPDSVLFPDSCLNYQGYSPCTSFADACDVCGNVNTLTIIVPGSNGGFQVGTVPRSCGSMGVGVCNFSLACVSITYQAGACATPPNAIITQP